MDNTNRRRLDLHGRWLRSYNGKSWDYVDVPSSLRPSGSYELIKMVLLPLLKPNERAILHLDGITYYATVSINKQTLGYTDAYVPHEFDATRFLKVGENEIRLSITDLGSGPNGAAKDDVAIGVNPGWEAYGGIIRDIYFELRPAAFIENVRFGYELMPGFSRGKCSAKVYVNCGVAFSGELTLALLDGLAEAAHVTAPVRGDAGASDFDLSFDIDNPSLWSPAHPHLYTLEATLQSNGITDRYSTRTGFRHLTIEGRRFIFNGEPLLLQGFCRHDTWKDQGFTLTRGQMREDMRAIKHTGANFVRLVHYPHHRYIIDLAEELGLLVTEEPGYWQVEFPSMAKAEIDTGLRIMEATVRRDWNSPAVFGWFLGNESRLTVDYLRAGKSLCNRLDPLERPVSFANDEPTQKAKALFEAAGLDFFSSHLYGLNRRKFDETADAYGPGKPLVIDEWGWEDAGRGQVLWERSFDPLLDSILEGKIAGHAFWSWNDVRQYARVDWPTHDGILFSGVVTEAREPRPELYERFSRLFRKQQMNPESARVGHDAPESIRPKVVPLRIAVVAGRGPTTPVDLQPVLDKPSSVSAWKQLQDLTSKHWSTSRMARDQWKRTGGRLLFWKERQIDVAGIPFIFAIEDGYVRPVVLTTESPVVIPIQAECSALYLLGNVTFPSGYPLNGKYGEIAAIYELSFANGAVESVPQRNGIEIARSNLIHDASRIDPVAVAAPRALLFEKDPAREHYQVLLYTLPTHGKRITEIRCKLAAGPPVAIFAITIQSPEAPARRKA